MTLLFWRAQHVPLEVEEYKKNSRKMVQHIEGFKLNLIIIDRGLKPSNVLLDRDWNPNILDFGMAGMFGGNQDQTAMTKVVAISIHLHDVSHKHTQLLLIDVILQRATWRSTSFICQSPSYFSSKLTFQSFSALNRFYVPLKAWYGTRIIWRY